MTMKAVWYERQGPARDVLIFGEMPAPLPGPGELRVRLAASAVNYADCYRRGGQGYDQEFPRVIPNSDGAGIVDRVGDGVSAALLGSRVWLYNGQRFRAFGTAAEYISLSADLVTELPDGVDFASGATLGIPAMTAHLAVFAAGSVHDRYLLVTGGAGAVGNYAIQLAKWDGAKVIATAGSADKARRAADAGADLVLDYRSEELAGRIAEFTGGSGVDHIVDVDFGGNLAATVACLRPGGSIAFYASRENPAPQLPTRQFIRKNLSLRAVGLPHAAPAERRTAQAGLSHWLRSAQPYFQIAARLPLTETAAAHEWVERGGKRGTVTISIDR